MSLKKCHFYCYYCCFAVVHQAFYGQYSHIINQQYVVVYSVPQNVITYSPSWTNESTGGRKAVWRRVKGI